MISMTTRNLTSLTYSHHRTPQLKMWTSRFCSWWSLQTLLWTGIIQSMLQTVRNWIWRKVVLWAQILTKDCKSKSGRGSRTCSLCKLEMMKTDPTWLSLSFPYQYHWLMCRCRIQQSMVKLFQFISFLKQSTSLYCPMWMTLFTECWSILLLFIKTKHLWMWGLQWKHYSSITWTLKQWMCPFGYSHRLLQTS